MDRTRMSQRFTLYAQKILEATQSRGGPRPESIIHPALCRTCGRPVTVGEEVETSRSSSAIRHADCAAAAAS